MKPIPLIFAALFLSLSLAACGETPAAETPAPSEPVSVVLSDGEPDGASAPESSAASGEAAAKTPVGEFWSIPDDTPSDQLMDLYPDFDLMSIPPIRPETAEEGETVGKIKAWWQSLSPDDPLLKRNLTMTPEER